jgi:two-component system sensor kinase FixL
VTAEIERLERRLAEADRRYRSLLEDLDVLAVGLDRVGRLNYVNRAFLTLTGYAREEVIGRDVIAVLVPESQQPAVQGVFDALMAQGLPSHYRNPIRMRSGEERIVDWHNTVLFDPDGDVEGTMSLGVDVTEHVKAETELRTSEARYRAIVAHSVDGIISIDERGVIESFNPAAEKLFGHAAHEVIGRNVSVLMPEPWRSEHDMYITTYIAGGAPRVIGIGREVVGMRADGSTFPMDLAVSELLLDGRRIFTGFVRDLTDRRRAEMLAEVGMIASAMAHEIGTPMNVILGRAEQLQRRTGDAPTRKALDVIIAEVGRVSRIMRQLLDYARPRQMERRLVDVNTPVQRALDMLRERVEQGGVKVEASLVTVSTQRLPAARAGVLRWREGGVELAVADTGCGIAADRLGQIFKPFFTTKERGVGTGLGLSVVQGIVRDHGGEVQVESRVGHGSVFRVQLPVAPGKLRSPGAGRGGL